MKIYQIVFSPTGGTQRTADILTAKTENYVNVVDLTNPQNDYSALNLKQDDIAIIAVPSYGGRVPHLAAERLSKINGGQAYCVVVCVYGNRAYEDTLIELYDIAEQNNFRVISAAAAVAEHSIIHQYATGRPDKQDEEELSGFAEQSLKKLKSPFPICLFYIYPVIAPIKSMARAG
ncbi:MAG: hypothetical protein LUD77_09430 [Clostridiales bacterium]|nr:hypothetical protein [Clostridiales bacterium]